MNDQYDNLLPALLHWLETGKRVAIATLVAIEGGSPRPIGAQLLVSDDAETLGAISSGCVEADIVLAAQQVIASGQYQAFNYGADSPYLDLTLPCGSSIKILITLAPSTTIVKLLCQQLATREDAALTLDTRSGRWLAYDETHRQAQHLFVCDYFKSKRLIAIGRNPILQHVMNLASASGIEVLAYSPDIAESNTATALNKPQDFNCPKLDAQTAVLVLFHDHDWEPYILNQLLDSTACYIGALGSLSSHQQRLQALSGMGWTAQQCERIASPAGLIKGTRHPQHIALSMVAQAMSELYR